MIIDQSFPEVWDKGGGLDGGGQEPHLPPTPEPLNYLDIFTKISMHLHNVFIILVFSLSP